MSFWKSVKAKIWDGVTVAKIDPVTKALSVISDVHLEVHEGEHFIAIHSDDTLDVAEKMEILIITPNTATRAHFKYYASSVDRIKIEFFEGTTVSANGTQITPKNNSRNSTTSSVLSIYHTPTVTADGTTLQKSYQRDAVPREEEEIILKQDEKYLLRVTSEKTSNKASAELLWYEEV